MTVDGVAEIWRLEWLTVPRLVCQPNDASWSACPCAGFAFGEAGELDLVRLRDSQRGRSTPSDAALLERGRDRQAPRGALALQRWPVREIDAEAFERANANGRREFRKRVLERKPGAHSQARRLQSRRLGDRVRAAGPEQALRQAAERPRRRQPRAREAARVRLGRSPRPPADPRSGGLAAAARREGHDPIPSSGPAASAAARSRAISCCSADASGIHAARETFACDPSGAKHGELVSREAL